MPLYIRPKANIARKGWHRWRGADNDPWFRITWWLWRPKFVLIELDSDHFGLDPRIYIDRGEGFDEERASDLQHVHTGLYIVDLASMPDAKRLRFDPASLPCEFYLRITAVRTESAAVRKLSRLTSAAYARRPAPPVCQVISESAQVSGNLQKYRVRLNQGQSVPAHYAHVAGLALAAETQADLPAPAPQDLPLISFVTPVFNTPPAYLDDLFLSLQHQRHRGFEWIIADDGSSDRKTIDWLAKHEHQDGVKIVRAARNGGIASATSLGAATARGQWLAVIDHDDALSPAAVFMIVQAIKNHPCARFIYTDEIVTDAALKPRHYFLKPAWDPVLLSGVNYINHRSLFDRQRLAEIGGFRDGFSGSQDFDCLLRYLADLQPGEIVHLPYPAYLWRRDGKSYSAKNLDTATQSARKALAQAYGRDGADMPVERAGTTDLHRLRLDQARTVWPRVSVIIPNRDSFELIKRILDDLTRVTDYPDLEIIVIDNGSQDARVLALYDSFHKSHHCFQAHVEAAPFNFSAQINKGLQLASGGAILLLNNDIEVHGPDWLREMVSCLDYSNAGIVGARLQYPDLTIQHAGVIVGLGGYAGHWCEKARPNWHGPMGRLALRQSFSAVTGACMLISRRCLEETGLFDEVSFAIAYNDIDYCLRAITKGYRVIWTPFVDLIHRESVSRGSDQDGANLERFQREQGALQARYKTQTYEDRAFNPWYTRGFSHPKLAYLRELPKSRI